MTERRSVQALSLSRSLLARLELGSEQIQCVSANKPCHKWTPEELLLTCRSHWWVSSQYTAMLEEFLIYDISHQPIKQWSHLPQSRKRIAIWILVLIRYRKRSGFLSYFPCLYLLVFWYMKLKGCPMTLSRS